MEIRAMHSLETMNRFSIKDIENLTGIKAHTIRIWEQRYQILQPKRTPTNIRYYDTGDLKMALRISLLNSYGYKISRIHQMNELEMNELVNKINDREFKLQVTVSDLLEATLAADIDKIEHIISTYQKKHGIEQMVEHLIFNFLEKIGLMWLTDRIFPAQEHLVSNIIYRKLSSAIEQLPNRNINHSANILLFLPEKEAHDLGLLYVYYLLAKYNKKPIYLGANSPISEVEYVYEIHKPKYMYVHLTSIADDFDVKKYLQKLSSTFPDCKVFISGSMLVSKKITQFNNLKFLYNLQEVRDELINL